MLALVVLALAASTFINLLVVLGLSALYYQIRTFTVRRHAAASTSTVTYLDTAFAVLQRDGRVTFREQVAPNAAMDQPEDVPQPPMAAARVDTQARQQFVANRVSLRRRWVKTCK
jgi:hypothetical protein